MFKSISRRLTFTYGILFLIAISLIDLILIAVYCQQQYSKTEKIYIQMAEIVSQMTVRNLNFPYFIGNTQNDNSLNGRILILNLKKEVVSDSLNQLNGQVIDNPEVREAYQKQKNAVGYYKQNGNRIAMLSHPMFKKNNFAGAVLISYSVSELWKDNLNFSIQVIVISISVLIIILLLTHLIGGKIAHPIRKMTFASLEILNGKTGTTVDIDQKDEIGTLADTFNKMSSELKRIELGRKRLLSSISHEFKTPLASMKALIEPFMEEEQVDPGLLKEHLYYVDSEIERLSKLVKSLVTVTRLEELSPINTVLDLFSEVNTVILLLSPMASDKNIIIENNIPSGLDILADKDLLREIIINLIDNAIKYGNFNGHISVSASKSDSYIELAFEDDGIGITKEDLPYIFDNFYMSDTARKSGKGSGIGLFMVKKIIELLKWDITAASSPSTKTRFVITIPLGDKPQHN